MLLGGGGNAVVPACWLSWVEDGITIRKSRIEIAADLASWPQRNAVPCSVFGWFNQKEN